jgi:DNA repair protein RecO (recombination protein O)
VTSITKGIIIRKAHSGDYDRQYVIYTYDFGKISAIAKGAKRTTSKLASHLEIFSSVDLMLAKGSGPYRIAGARDATNYKTIRRNISKVAAAYTFLEALDNLVVYDFYDKVIFELIEGFFNEIDKAINLNGLTVILNKYLFRLLSHLGYQPQIKSQNQRQLARELCKSVITSSEKELRSESFFIRLLAV